MTRRRPAQALVEFAFILPLLLLVFLGIIETGRAVWQENQLAFAAREATRYAIVHGSRAASPSGPGSPTWTSPDTDSAVTAEVLKYTAGIRNVVVKTTYPDGTNDRGARVVVDVYAEFTPLPSDYLLGGALRVTLHGGSQLVIQR